MEEKSWGEIDPQDYQEELAGYPLVPNLEYYYLLNNIKLTTLERFSDFFTHYPNFNNGTFLRKQLLLFLGKKKHWQEFDSFYRKPSYYFSQSNVNQIECYKISHKAFILNTLQSEKLSLEEKARQLSKLLAEPIPDLGTTQNPNYEEVAVAADLQKNIESLYLQGNNLPNNCKTIVKTFDREGLLSDNLKLQRMTLALKNKNYQLAKDISELLNKESKEEFKLSEVLRNDPLQLVSIHEDKSLLSLPIKDTELNRFAVLNALHVLLRYDSELSYSLWKVQQKHFKFTAEQVQKFNHQAALYLYINDAPDFNDWLELANANLQNSSFNRKMLILAIKSQSWSEIISLYHKLSKKEKQETIWQYWFARSHIEYDQGSKVHPNALTILEDLSAKRDYYGFLASFHLKKSPSIAKSNNQVKDSDLESIAKLEGIVRAHEFYMLEDNIKANREWFAATSMLTREKKGQAALLAFQWGWLQRAISTAANSNEFNNINMRFPRGFAEHVNFYASKYAIPNEWVFSVIRQESAYGPEARSSAGALGLMQIMPATGKDLAKQNNIDGFKPLQLTEPELNINLATYFLAQLRERYHGNMLLASAAYNAGPSNVDRWLRETQENNTDEELPIEMWIESIPFKETRNYVKNIFTYQIIYQQELGRESTAKHLLLPIKLLLAE